AKVNAVDNDGITALMLATMKGNYRVVRLLILSGADETMLSKKGVNAAMIAAGEEFADITALYKELERARILLTIFFGFPGKDPKISRDKYNNQNDKLFRSLFPVVAPY
ncbi:MAG TPA: hypothetical protein DC017_05480, partial [Candidatus Wallbacteria bacterium]|nr:hypothetical protein [Candidatus Wallbacteria bacterium]